MQIRFLKRKSENRKLKIAFLGFSFDTDIILRLFPELSRINTKLQIEEFDLAIVDFTSAIHYLANADEVGEKQCSIKEILDVYDEVFLYAHSFGVYAAGLFFSAETNFCSSKIKHKIHSAFAFSGTLQPINDEQGIPLRVFALTQRNFNDATLQTFRLRCGLKQQDIPHSEASENFSEALALVQQVYNHYGKPDFHYDYAVVAMNDKIFPSRNQFAAWHNETKIISEDCNHFEALGMMIDKLTKPWLERMEFHCPISSNRTFPGEKTHHDMPEKSSSEAIL